MTSVRKDIVIEEMIEEMNTNYCSSELLERSQVVSREDGLTWDNGSISLDRCLASWMLCLAHLSKHAGKSFSGTFSPS